MTALAVWTAFDGLLSATAPLGLAAAAGTALVVDLDPDGPAYPGRASLADLVADGPRRADLVPSRDGVAVLRNGGVEATAAREVIQIQFSSLQLGSRLASAVPADPPNLHAFSPHRAPPFRRE